MLHSMTQSASQVLRQLAMALFALWVSLPLGAGTVLAQSERIQLPDIGLSASNVFSPHEERAYRQRIMQQLRIYDLLVDDPLINDYFSDLSYKLVANSQRPTDDFVFVVIKDPTLNAFAAPGGLVAAHAGLILAADTESEVAGVIGHEIAHVTQRHLARAFENARQVSIPLALLLVGLIIATGGAGEAIQGGLLGSQALAAQSQINFTRQNEQEADRIGIQTMAAAGYDPAGMASFFGKVQRTFRANGEGPPEFLRTHPVSSNRIAEAKDRAAQMAVSHTGPNPDFLRMQARLRVLSERYPETAIRYFNTQLNQNQASGAAAQAHRYGLAVAYQRAGNYNASGNLVGELLEADDQVLAYQLLAAELDLQAGRNDEALARLESLHSRFQGNHAIAVNYVEALLRENQPEPAVTAAEVVRDQLLVEGREPALFDLYARAAEIAGDPVRAGEARAETLYLNGQLYPAIQLLERLARRDDLDFYHHSRITARLAELQKEFAEQGRPRPPQNS